MGLEWKLVVAAAALLSACSTTVGTTEGNVPEQPPAMALTIPVGPATQEPGRPKPPPSPQPWQAGKPVLQGFLGVTFFDEIERNGGRSFDVETSDIELPAIGGGGQWKLGGERIDFGLEGMLGFSWESGATAFASGGGGAVLAVDVDLLVFDLYGGPFASMFLGEKLRVYVAAGPMMNWARYDQEGSALDADGDGFGVGYYARTGLELVLPGSMLGVGVRWSDSTIDLDGGLGELEMEGFQVAFTVSRYF